MSVADVCDAAILGHGDGVAALVAGRQVAILRDDDGRLHAIDNRDPFSGANVLSRGLVGTHAGRATVASPLRKQRFDLQSGVCLDDPAVSVRVHGVAVVDGQVQVSLNVAHDSPDTSA